MKSVLHTVEHGSLINISAELSRRVVIQRQIELLLLATEVITANNNCSWWQT